MYEVKFKTETLELATTIFMVLTELTRAKEKHPIWPQCNIHRCALIVEEAGEAIREANRIAEGVSFLSELKTELVQTAAIAIRHLEILALEAKNTDPVIDQLGGTYFNNIT